MENFDINNLFEDVSVNTPLLKYDSILKSLNDRIMGMDVDDEDKLNVLVYLLQLNDFRSFLKPKLKGNVKMVFTKNGVVVSPEKVLSEK